MVKLPRGGAPTVGSTTVEEDSMHRLTCSVAVAVAAVATLSAGCTRTSAESAAVATGSPAVAAPAPSADGPSGPTTTDADGARSATGPAGARGTLADPTAGAEPTRQGCTSHDVPVDGLLQAMRTGHHAGFDRVVLEFCGSQVPPHRLAYVDEVRRDPSDRPLPLRGRAFVRLVVRGGTTTTAPIAAHPATAPRYHGPARLTPHYPLLADVAIAGDFERVLSFGIGLRQPAGLHVTVLSAPPRLVVDVLTRSPGTLVWPARTLTEARRLQVAAFEGHQPWWLPGNPQSMAAAYAHRVLGWPQPELRRITPTVYQVQRAGTDDTAVLTLTQPVCPGNPHGLWNVADIAR
jgi:hypothetical protein